MPRMVGDQEIEEVTRWFEAAERESHRFETIPEGERLHQDRRLCGMLYIAQLLLPGAKLSLNAEHGQIYFNGLDDCRRLSLLDVLYLRRCGVFFDSDADCLSMFTLW